MYDWIDDSVKKASAVFQQFGLDWNFRFHPGAEQQQIAQCERDLNLSLPHSYREFLRRYNGAHLFYSAIDLEYPNSDPCWAASGIKIFGTTELLLYRRYRQETASPYDELEDQSILGFAYLGRVGTSDFCALDTAQFSGVECPVLDCDHDYSSSEWKEKIIAASFEEWLIKVFDRIINHNSPPEYWFSDTQQDNSLTIIANILNS